MARTSRPLIDVQGLEDLRASFDALGKYAFADALQDAINVVAGIAQERMAGEFERGVEGGPARFSKVLPGSKSSSVLLMRHKRATGGVASAEIQVQDKQARYLQFLLGERQYRSPGVAGVASRYNFLSRDAVGGAVISVRDILAFTVALSLLGSDVVLTIAGAEVPTRGTWLSVQTDAEFLSGVGTATSSVLRIPSAGIAKPAEGTRVTVDGKAWKVSSAHERGATYLLDLKRLAVR